MKRLLFTCLAVSAFAMAMALTSFSKIFVEKYDVDKGSTLGKAACAVCHIGAKGGKLNPYGKDVQTEMKAGGLKKLSAAVLGKVEKLDSDKDGVKNVDEIKKGTLPGAK